MIHLFPKIMIVLDLCAAVVYFKSGDNGRVLYWLSAACITYSSIII